MRLPTLGYSLGTSCLISLHSGHGLIQLKSSAQTWQDPDKTISPPWFAVNFRPYYVPLQIANVISTLVQSPKYIENSLFTGVSLRMTCVSGSVSESLSPSRTSQPYLKLSTVSVYQQEYLCNTDNI